MSDNPPPVHADFGDPCYEKLLAHSVNSAPGLQAAFLENLGTGQCLADPARSAANPDIESRCRSLCSHLFKGQAASGLGVVTEVMFWYEKWALVACRESGSDRILAAALPAGMEISAAMRRLAGLAVVAGDSPPDDGAGQSLILNHDSLQRAGQLPAAGELLGDDAAAITCLRALFDQGSTSPLDSLAGTLRDVQVVTEDRRIGFRRIPFAPDHVVVIAAADELSPDGLGRELRYLGYEILRNLIRALLADDGLNVPDTSLPEDDQAFNRVIAELRSLPNDDLYSLLRVGGFANHRLGEQGEMEDGAMVYRCQECIYYLTNRKWCDLPELPVPVEPDWYCRLWKL